MPKYKTLPLSALDYGGSLAEGEFRALVAAFGNVDDQGERIRLGAFKATLDDWAIRGDPIPVVWSHQWFDPFAHIGEVLTARETDAGLSVHGQLDLENPTAAQVHRLLKSRRVKAWSFAYDVDDAEQAEDGALDLLAVTLHEVGPALVGANPLAETIDAKTLQAPNVELVEVGTATATGLTVTGGAVEVRLVEPTPDVASYDRKRALALRAAALDLRAKAPVASHSTATSESSWDGPAAERRVRSGESPDYYRRVYAWQDPDGDPEAKVSWRFIHHEVDGDGNPGPANVRALTSAIGVLNGGRGGTTIPRADRQGVWAHLARHLRDADHEPPPLQ